MSLPFFADQSPHDFPTAEQLLSAVRSWISDELSPTLSGAQRFDARVAANMLAMVERELKVGEQHRIEHRAGLAALGMADDVELAAALRSGSLDDRLAEVATVVAESLRNELSVSDPGYTDSPTI